jgi:electron transport complex protein RnfG
MGLVRASACAAIVALVIAGLAAAAAWWSERVFTPRIAAARAAAHWRILEPIAGIVHDNDPLSDRVPLPGLAAGAGYRLRRGADVVAIIVPVTAPNGYSGPIELAIAVDAGRRVLGVRVLAHRETAGVGDRAFTDGGAWLAQFAGRDLRALGAGSRASRRNGGAFDAVSGATVTSAAVMRAVERALDYVERDYTRLFERLQAG